MCGRSTTLCYESHRGGCHPALLRPVPLTLLTLATVVFLLAIFFVLHGVVVMSEYDRAGKSFCANCAQAILRAAGDLNPFHAWSLALLAAAVAFCLVVQAVRFGSRPVPAKKSLTNAS